LYSISVDYLILRHFYCDDMIQIFLGYIYCQHINPVQFTHVVMMIIL